MYLQHLINTLMQVLEKKFTLLKLLHLLKIQAKDMKIINYHLFYLQMREQSMMVQ